MHLTPFIYIMSCIAPPRAWHSQHATETENHTKAIQSVDPCFSGGTVASGTCHTLGVTTMLSDRLSVVVPVAYLRSLLWRLLWSHLPIRRSLGRRSTRCVAPSLAVHLPFCLACAYCQAGRLSFTAVPAATGLPVTLTGSSSDSVLRALGSSAPAAYNIGSRSHLATLSGSFHHGLVFRS